MEKLNIDVGLKRYQLVEGGEPLTFNPADPNVYARYMEMVPKIEAVEREMAEKAKSVDASKADAGEKALELMRETDRRMKEVLNQIFGEGTDFDKILCGVNLMAVTGSGNRVVSNLLDALSPIMNAGAKSFVDSEISEAKLNRDQRRALQ